MLRPVADPSARSETGLSRSETGLSELVYASSGTINA